MKFSINQVSYSLYLLLGSIFFILFASPVSAAPGDFITKWKTDNVITNSSAANQIEIYIPTTGSNIYNFNIDWGDGNSNQNISNTILHTYSTPGTYTISISGNYPAITFGNFYAKDKAKLISVEQWGNTLWTTMRNAFFNCSNVTIDANDVPNLSNVTSMFAMFRNASSFNQSINDWDVSNVTDMRFMFSDASSFNQPINNWDVSNVTSMNSMFSDARSFNQPINNWDISNVTSMNSMFNYANSFNQPINDWDVSNVTNMGFMFSDASSFNQPINDWDVSNVTSMDSMFDYASSFNQPINDWDVSNVTSMFAMFRNASSFNQPINNWDVSNVTDMGFMFSFVPNFNQPIENWDISNVSNFSRFIRSASYSTENYDKFLEKWSTLPLQQNITFSVGNIRYSQSEAARNHIISTFNWNIIDGGKGYFYEILLTNNSITISNGDTTPSSTDNTDFGIASISNSSSETTFTIDNVGDEIIELLSVKITGTNSQDFTITSTPSPTINLDSSTSFKVAFNPTTQGIKNATIEISSENSDVELHTFAIRGTGEIDTDRDGIPNSLDPDDDNDGLEDLLDNCSLIPNSRQDDADRDGTGDVCDNSSLPTTITSLAACNSCSEDHVLVSWLSHISIDNYSIYRSQFEGDRGALLTTLPFNTNQYLDISAIPGVTYYYTLIGVNSAGVGANSNIAEGTRSLPPLVGPDSDGDGVHNDQEVIDQTDPRDPGSFMLHLNSPAYTKYNTFLDQFNFLELTATGENPVNATITLYDINGFEIPLTNEQRIHTIAPLAQKDIDIHSLVGKKDTYGVVKIEFDQGIGTTLSGRMSNYKLNSDGATYSFAFSKELRNPKRGVSFATANSFDPQGQGYTVPNWLEIINLDTVGREFTYKLYLQDGSLQHSETITVPSLGEKDFPAGHTFGEGVYLAEIIPTDGATNYFSTVTRYSSNEVIFTGDSFNFAIPIDARAGTSENIYVPITNKTGDCWRQTNWVEIVNTREKAVTATVEFYNLNGAVLSTQEISLKSKEQQHLNASGVLATLGNSSSGSIRVKGSDRGSIISQGLVYYHDCGSNLTQTAYATSARIPGRNVQSGTFNTFLGIKNQLSIVSTTSEASSAELRALYLMPSNQSQLVESMYGTVLNPLQAETLLVNSSDIFSLPENTNGILRGNTNLPGQILIENLRLRIVGNRVDFAMPTVIQ